jgi:hypothetical protein
MPAATPSLPTIDFRRIRSHNGSQHRGFEELCYQLVHQSESVPNGTRFERLGVPDGGVEFIALLPDGAVWAWQAKYLFTLDQNNFGQLDESVKSALASQPRLERYTFCLPYDRPAGASGESAMRRWRTHQETWQGWAREAGRGNVDFQYKGESDLLSLLTQEQHAGRAFYWFDATVLSRDWFKAHLDEALAHAGPRYTPALNIELPVSFIFEGLGRTPAFKQRIREHLRDIRDRRDHCYSAKQMAKEDLVLHSAAQVSRPDYNWLWSIKWGARRIGYAVPEGRSKRRDATTWALTTSPLYAPEPYN